MNNATQPVFSKRNYYFLFASLATLAAGFIIMSLDTEAYGFGILGLTVGPALVVLGLLLPFLSVFSGNKKANKSKFDLLDSIAGWCAFAVALLVYVLTLEPTTSFWDCGEFIACSYKLQVPHPPGAPLFLLVGRMFSLLALGDVTRVAYWVNMVSAVSGAFTILFLFWTITLLARRMLLKPGAEPAPAQAVLILGSGLIGAFSYTFSDSFWFSAVEAEVYAFSSFFTAFVVWAMLKWSTTEERRQRYQWLILIAYMIGLSIGVHLLNLVAIPAMAFIYYHRHYRFTYIGAITTLLVSLLLIAIIMWGIIPGLPALAGSFEIFFVNALRFPYGGGIIVFLLIFIVAVVWLLRFSIRKQKQLMQTAVLCFIYILIGYSSYLIIPIRSSYDPLVDESNPEDILSFVSYLRREQYEQRPLLYGPQFASRVVEHRKERPLYTRSEGKYSIADYKYKQVYHPSDLVLMPRIYSSAPHHLREYKKWVSISEGKIPAMGENLSYLLRYQLGHMYWRYFLWNFAGRESDIQHAGVLWPWEQNEQLPHNVATNKARNNYYLLPLLLGIAGCVYHFRKRKDDALVVMLLFLFTGMAIAFFLNQPPSEPRERDYAFAGSFYAFAVWIGLGVIVFESFFGKLLKKHVAASVAALLLCLAVPAVMAAEGWNDHDRSGRYYAVDFARNLLESCEPNAILFTNGDNDTFPLWYAQEVEGLRRDVRVIVLSYLSSEWYIDQMKRQAYESEPLPISLGKEHYNFNVNSYLPFAPHPKVTGGVDLKQFVELVKQEHPALKRLTEDGRSLMTIPAKKFFLKIDKQAVLQHKAVPKDREQDIVEQLQFEISGGGMERKDLVMADILVNNNWKRPVYFSTSSSAEFMSYLRPYLQLEGLALRVVPARNPDPEAEYFVARERMHHNLLEQFRFRSLDNPEIHYDNTYQSQLVPMFRKNFALLAAAHIKAGDVAKAKEVLEFVLSKMPDDSLPFDYNTPVYVELLAKTGQEQKAGDLAKLLEKRSKNALEYYAKQKSPALFEREINLNMLCLQQLIMATYAMGKQEQAAELEQFFMQYYNLLMKNS